MAISLLAKPKYTPRIGLAEPHNESGNATQMASIVLLSDKDNVAIATTDLAIGMPVKVGDLTVEPQVAVPRGHKIAIRKINAGQPITKYGQPIGLASSEIAIGEHVHLHNVEHHHTVADQAVISGFSPPRWPSWHAKLRCDYVHRELQCDRLF